MISTFGSTDEIEKISRKLINCKEAIIPRIITYTILVLLILTGFILSVIKIPTVSEIFETIGVSSLFILAIILAFANDSGYYPFKFTCEGIYHIKWMKYDKMITEYAQGKGTQPFMLTQKTTLTDIIDDKQTVWIRSRQHLD